jgi:formylglycine-generating enzyme required for sulfatase activity
LASSITLEGIDEALENLGYYSKSSPKSKFLTAVRHYYKNSEDLNKINQIPLEIIVSRIWDIPYEEKSKINSRKKNALSLKNTINKDLQKLFNSGLNPEGIMINDNNIFSMSDNAREKLLSSITSPFADENEISLSQISQVLNSIKEFIEKNREKNLDQSGFESIQSLISDIEKSFEEKEGQNIGDGEDTGKKTVTIELDEGEEIEEVFEDDEDDEEIVEEDDETQEIIDDTDDSELIELDEDQELVDDEDYQEEEDDDDLTEESDETELIEVDEDEDIEDTKEDQIELEDDDELVEADEIDDSEIIELDEDDELIDEQIDFEEESINDDSIEEFDELLQDEEDVLDIDEEESDDSEVVELDEDQELVDDEDYEEEAIDDDLIEEIDELSQDEEIVSDIDEDELDDTELLEIDEDEDSEDTEEEQIELDDDEELIEADEIELDEDQEIIDEEDEHKLPELGLPSESLGEFESYLESQNIDSKNLLSEKFDSYLGAMDRYYNQFLKIEKNTYKTGCPYPSSDLKPESKINLNEFFIGAFPITNSLFEIFIEKTGYKTTAEEKGFSTVFESRYKSEFDYKTGKQKSILSSTGKSTIIRGACWYQPFGPGSGLHKKRSHPVVHISLKDALSFGAWIGKRLPTEDEWEAAARTNKGFPFPWGSQWIENASNTENCGKGDTSAVDEYIKGINSNKISDTLGNVWEWTTSSIEKAEKTFYIAKGGSFVSDQSVRLWSRYFVKPDFTSNILGFRCVAD